MINNLIPMLRYNEKVITSEYEQKLSKGEISKDISFDVSDDNISLDGAANDTAGMFCVCVQTYLILSTSLELFRISDIHR